MNVKVVPVLSSVGVTAVPAAFSILIVVIPRALTVAPTSVLFGMYGPVTSIPTSIFLYSASKTISDDASTRIPIAIIDCNSKSPPVSCSGLVGLEVLLVGYNTRLTPAESTQLIFV